MSKPISLFALTITALLTLTTTTAATAQPITLRSGLLLDGKGASLRNQLIAIDGPRISRIAHATATPAHLRPLAPHRSARPDRHPRPHRLRTSATTAAPPTRARRRRETALYAAENAYVTLMAGFTTVQSIGSPCDLELRAAIARGALPGPRLLTSIGSLNDATRTPDQIRA